MEARQLISILTLNRAILNKRDILKVTCSYGQNATFFERKADGNYFCV